MNDNKDVELYCGKPNEPGDQDGIVTSARFHSPHGIANMGSTWLIATLEISLADLSVTLAL